MGHAMDETLQDILIRWQQNAGLLCAVAAGHRPRFHRNRGQDRRSHAQGEGITKEDIGREKFLERAWAWKDEYGGRIVEQLKKLGSSCDWDRERFTMDEGCSKAVQRGFREAVR